MTIWGKNETYWGIMREYVGIDTISSKWKLVRINVDKFR